ncbi:hypothetical protein SmJEL517_g01134 [Synchytrium microbalum]|uniref:Polyadenylate-binding protein n=1 Tax=Synchytrium microbalum TaxID=1806994 RepID=A0A507C6G3_9FUNG|nr:uncharacterized protein SmJEL517_g01134 [Synchytrium microbalum]TPX36627.1 hypothetical protein SmJEL517_g01134 [Synchytrium microbalum]
MATAAAPTPASSSPSAPQSAAGASTETAQVAAPATSTTTSTTSTATAPAASAAATSTSSTSAGLGPSASLYVGDLDPTITEAMLFEIFNNIGAVQSIRVCKDAATRRSLGYAYVNFHNVADGEKALEALNYYSVKGRPIRIMWSQRDPSLRRSGTGNIFIKNLDTEIDNKALHDTFSAFGHILSCKVAQDEQGASRGYGFVHYETYDAADAAIKAVNGMLLNDKKVYVGFHVPKKERLMKAEDQKAKFTNVYIKNLDEAVTEDELRKMFEEYGEITSLLIQRNDDGTSRGFAFINYGTPEEANLAVDGMNDKDINGKTLYVGRAQKKAEREEELRRQYERAREEKLNKYQGVNLYIKNLDESIDDEKLRAEFGVYGTITSAKVMREEKPAIGDMPATSVSKGFGFVCFSSPDEATKAVTEMNNKLVNGKPIYVALAQRKELRRQQLAQQMQQRQQLRPPMGPGMAGMPTGYPGQPMYYQPQPGMPQPRGGMFFPPPQQMMQRPRYGGMPQQMNGPQMGPGGYPMGPGMPQYGAPMPGMPMPQFAGQPPQQRPGPGGPMSSAQLQAQQQAMASQAAQAAQQRPGGPRPPMPQVDSKVISSLGPGVPRPMGPGVPPQMGGPRPGMPMQGQPGVVPPSAGRGRGTPYKYTSNARNAPMPGAPMGMVGYPAGPRLNAATLASLPADAQKRMLGEALFPLVQNQTPAAAGKVTGMLLEMDNGELLHLLEDQESLTLKVKEAVGVLDEHMKGGPGARMPMPDQVVPDQE